MLEACVTNLGKYNEGRLISEDLKFPTTTEEVQALLKHIHVDGVRYEELFIADYNTDIPGLRKRLGEYESLDELNYLASLLDDLGEWEFEKFVAALDFGEHDGAGALINLAQNLDCFEFYPGIEDEEDLGRYYIEEMCALDVPEHLKGYIDYEAYGRDMDVDEDGRFADGGYIVKNGNSFIEHYKGREDMPEDCRVFAFPKPEKSIKKAIAGYQQMISEAPAIAADRTRPANAER